MNGNTLKKGRITLLGILICAFALMLAGRLYYLQAMRSDEYLDQADRQYVRKGTALFDRGTIFMTDKTGKLVSAGTLKTGYIVAVEPKKIVEPEDVVNGLSGILEFDEDELIDIIEDSTDPYEEIAKRVDEASAARIEALDLKGVGLFKERWRYYPGNERAANVLGFTAFGDDGKTITGRYGLERYYNDVLSRESSDLYVNFFAQIFSDISEAIFVDEKSEGDIVTTLEPSVQAELEKQIASVVKAWKSDLTGGIVMDPYTGEIYAMAVDPTFNPNEFSKAESKVFGNALVDRVYEMGSIIKPLAMAAGLDANVITPTTTFNDQGYVLVNGAKIQNFDGRGRGVVDMQKVLNDSLNTGMAFVTQKLGNDGLTDYFMSFGFGEETGIDLPGEVHGLVKNLKSPRDIEHVTASFGQGIAMTPVETVRALSALGNGGYLPNPHLVKRIEYASGESKEVTYENSKPVLKPETSESITRMLVKVVDEALLNGKVKLKDYSVAAKTGTAQMAIETGGGYYGDRYLHSFFGYFPAYKPRFIVFLFTVHPKGAEYASHTLTYPFIDLTKFLINYYEIPPDR